MLFNLFELLMAVLACVSVWLATQPDTDAHFVASMAIWGLFVVEYVVRLVRAPVKRAFVRDNFLDLVAILPWDFLRAARLVRLMRVFRLLRGIEVLWRVGRHLTGILKTNGLSYALGVTGLLILSAGLVIQHVEPRITSAGDGIWWSLVTATTVGYGDIAPRTQEGRIIAAILMLVGIGAIGMVTGSIATYFLGSRGSTNPHVRHVQQRLDEWDVMSLSERREVVRLLHALTADPDQPLGESERVRD